MTTAMKRPQLHELVKEAVAGTVSKVDIDVEAERQLANMGEGPPVQEKTAAVAAPAEELTPSDYIEKLAGALDYGANLLKQADVAETKLKPGEGPNALQVLEAPGGENPVKPGNQGGGVFLELKLKDGAGIALPQLLHRRLGNQFPLVNNADYITNPLHIRQDVG